MALVNNAEVLGKSGRNLVLQTAGHVYIKVNERYYELDFKNQNSKGQFIGNPVPDEVVKDAEEVDLTDYVTNEDLKRTLKKYVTERSFQDVKDTQQMLENSMLDFTESIKPITVQTMQVIVGTDELQFDWVTSFEDMSAADAPLYIDKKEFNAAGTPNENYDQLVFQPGYIKHYTIDGPDKLTPANETSVKDYWRWYILNSEGEDKVEPVDMSNNYYVYLKVPYEDYHVSVNAPDNPGAGPHGGNIYCTRGEDDEDYNQVWWLAGDVDEGGGVYTKTGVGRVVYSPDAIEYGPVEENGVTYYHLLYATVNNSKGTSSVSQMNGFTEITPGQIRAYLFANAEGTSYLDLRKNVLVLGNDAVNPKLAYNVNGDGTLYIDGAIVQNTQIQDGGGNKSDLTVYRGEWSADTQYCPSNTVIVTNGDSVESYRFKGGECTTEAGSPLTDTMHWECISKGSASVITRVRKFQSVPDSGTTSLIFNDGSTEESDGKKYLDFVHYNGLYYQCVDYQAYSSEKPIQIPGEGSGWTLINNFKPVATSVLLVGKDDTGWIIDDGVIKHTNEFAEITKDGTIELGSKAIITWMSVSDSSKKFYTVYGFEEGNESTTIDLNAESYRIFETEDKAFQYTTHVLLKDDKDDSNNRNKDYVKGYIERWEQSVYGNLTLPCMYIIGEKYFVCDITPIAFRVECDGTTRVLNLQCYGGNAHFDQITIGQLKDREEDRVPACINGSGDLYCNGARVFNNLDLWGPTFYHRFGGNYNDNGFLISRAENETLDDTQSIFNYSGSVYRAGTALSRVTRTGSFNIMTQKMPAKGGFLLPEISFGLKGKNIASANFTLTVSKSGTPQRIGATLNGNWTRRSDNTFYLSSADADRLELGSISVEKDEVVEISVNYSIHFKWGGELTIYWDTWGKFVPDESYWTPNPMYKFLIDGVSLSVGDPGEARSFLRIDKSGIKLNSNGYEINMSADGIIFKKLDKVLQEFK